ncbi:MAG: T9SS type A sorting domain-containing protein [Saprospiraceae bacterium]|nr:T9SS type A sorting domain-containing protein [Saprospiraceae bacterium]
MMNSFIKIDDNTFVVGGFKSPIYQTGQFAWSRSRIFAVDSTGSIKWDWLGPLNEEGLVCGLHRTADGGWIYLSTTNEPNPDPDPSETHLGHVKVVRRDSAFNLLWERVLSAHKSYYNQPNDLVATPDGNWVASGFWFADTLHQPCFYKLSDQGDSLWCKCFLPPDGSMGNSSLGGMTVLPSGSVVLALRYDRYGPGPSQTLGWLVKIDNSGCMDTLCQLSRLFSPPPPAPVDVRVWPNPASQEVFFDCASCQQNRAGAIVVYTPAGQLIWQGTLAGANPPAVWPASQTAPGLYFYQVIFEGQPLASGKISILR